MVIALNVRITEWLRSTRSVTSSLPGCGSEAASREWQPVDMSVTGSETDMSEDRSRGLGDSKSATAWVQVVLKERGRWRWGRDGQGGKNSMRTEQDEEEVESGVEKRWRAERERSGERGEPV